MSLSLTLVDAQLPLDIAHTEQQNYLNNQLRITTEEAQRKRLEEEEVLSRLRQMRERVEGKEKSVRQLDQDRRVAADAALADKAAKETKVADLWKERRYWR